MRFEGASLEFIRDLFANLDGCAASGRNSARVWNQNFTLLVDCLVRNSDEVARADACVGREKAASCGLENRDADNIAYPEAKCLWWGLSGKRRG